jgi:hypothetical protein
VQRRLYGICRQGSTTFETLSIRCLQAIAPMTEPAMTPGDEAPLRVAEEAWAGAAVAGSAVVADGDVAAVVRGRGAEATVGVGGGRGVGSTVQSKIPNSGNAPGKIGKHLLMGWAWACTGLHVVGSKDKVYAADAPHDVALKYIAIPNEGRGPNSQLHPWSVKIKGLGADEKVLDMFWQVLSVKAVIFMMIRGGWGGGGVSRSLNVTQSNALSKGSASNKELLTFRMAAKSIIGVTYFNVVAVTLCQVLIMALHARTIDTLLALKDVTWIPWTAIPTTCASDATNSCCLNVQPAGWSVKHAHTDEGLNWTEARKLASEKQHWDWVTGPWERPLE